MVVFYTVTVSWGIPPMMTSISYFGSRKALTPSESMIEVQDWLPFSLHCFRLFTEIVSDFHVFFCHFLAVNIPSCLFIIRPCQFLLQAMQPLTPRVKSRSSNTAYDTLQDLILSLHLLPSFSCFVASSYSGLLVLLKIGQMLLSLRAFILGISSPWYHLPAVCIAVSSSDQLKSSPIMPAPFHTYLLSYDTV